MARKSTKVEMSADTEGENGAGKPADTPQVPAEGHTAGQGGEGETLPANPTEVTLPEPVAQAAEGANPDLSTIIVICRAKGGRRRVGRRWAEGRTELAASDLTETEISILQGDPRFSVLVEQE